MERAPIECVCCGGTDRGLLVRIGAWTVYKCAGCGLGVLDPRPGPMERDALYRESYFADRYEEALAPGAAGMERRLSQEAHRIRFFGRFARKGLVLDIGCGRGYFLHACRRRGYDAVGVDVSEDAAASVRETLGIPVKTGPLRNELFDPGSIDIVTMWHSLEHTADPVGYVEQARAWLRPGGLLVVDVPNHEGTDARKFGAAWGDWDLPYHLFHFNPGSLAAVVTRAGFRIVASRDYHSEYVKKTLRRIPVAGFLARPIAKLFSGGSYAVVAVKAARPPERSADANRA